MRFAGFTAGTLLVLSLGMVAVAGETEEDRKVEAMFRQMFNGIVGVESLAVKESLAIFQISESFYRNMLADKVSSKKLVRLMVTKFQEVSGRKSVTVWLYFGDTRVVEGDVSMFGEISVEFPDE